LRTSSLQVISPILTRVAAPTAARRSALFHIPLNPRQWTLPECARPIMLRGANPRDNGDKERCRPPKQDDAVGALNRPQDWPVYQATQIAYT